MLWHHNDADITL